MTGIPARRPSFYVTHDQVEAMTMGHRVAVRKDGVLQQVDSPRRLYDEPVNAFVAGFIGSPAMNLRTVSLVQGGALLGNVTVPLAPEALAAASRAQLEQVVLGLRPEALSSPGDAGDGLRLEVTLVEELGSDTYLYGQLAGDAADERPFVVRFNGRATPRIGETVALHVQFGSEHAFDPVTGHRLV
jgi:multiple sugar transport system ATP-binding protein